MLRQTVCSRCSAVNRITDGHDAAAAKCGRCSGNLELGQPLEVDDAALARHLERSEGPILVDVWAPWCGPCRAMTPIFAEAARSLAGQARLLKLNADNSSAIRHFGVSGIPALLLFRNGRIIDRRAGLMRADTLVRWVREHSAAPTESQTA